MKEIVNFPNDTVVIICKINDNLNNTYTILPTEVAIGKIQKNNTFKSEDGEKIVPPLEDSFNITSDTEEFYAFAISVEELKEKYKELQELTLMMYVYSKDISSRLNIALNSEGKVYIYSKNYDSISETIQGTVKKYFDAETPEQKALPEIVTEHAEEDYIDEIGLEKYLKERIFANDSILEDIATTLASNYTAQYKDEVEPMLSIGPTGSGKTATLEAAAEFLGVPFTIFDCNSLTSAGYVGKDIEDIMRKIYLTSNENIKAAERSILYLDEVDKLSMRGNDVKDATVQFALLKLLDGYSYNFEKKKNGPIVTLDTSFMSICFSGAFPDMYTAKEKESRLGFNSDIRRQEVTSFDTDDLVKFGMLRELVGRIYNIYTYKELTKDELKQIVLYSKNSPILRKRERYLREYYTELELQESFIDALVEQAFLSKSGGRGLNKAVAATFKKIDRQLIQAKQTNPSKNIKKLVLTQETVENPSKFNI